MPLETVSYISDLVITNPDGADQRSTADDHLRNIKKAIAQTFPNIAGQVSVSHAELNRLDGISANIETRLDAHLASISAINTTISGMATTISAHTASISAINTTISGMTTTLNAHGASISAINTTISGMTTTIGNISAIASQRIQPSTWNLYHVWIRGMRVGGLLQSLSTIALPDGWEVSNTASAGVGHLYVVHNMATNIPANFRFLSVADDYYAGYSGDTATSATFDSANRVSFRPVNSNTFIASCVILADP